MRIKLFFIAMVLSVVGYAQNNFRWLNFSTATTSGTDTYTLTVTNYTAYHTGDYITVKFGNANTTTATLNINSLGAVAIKKSGSTGLSSGDIAAGEMKILEYDGTNFQILGGSGGGGGGSSTFVGLSDGPGAFTGKSLNYNRVNVGETALEYRTPSQVLSDISGVSTSRSLTIAGTSFDLSADRTWTLSNLSIGAELISGGATTYNGSAAKTLAIQSGSVTNAMLAGSISDGNLATSYIKADGTRAFTGDQSLGTNKLTNVKELDIAGTAGAGFINFVAQSSNASAPAATGFNLFAGSTGNLRWAKKNGTDIYVRGLVGTLTADRDYTLPDIAGTVHLIDGGQTITSSVWNGTKISEAYGGTNQSTYTTGDLLYASASNTLSKLAIGSSNQVLTVSGGVPTWATLSGSISSLRSTANITLAANTSAQDIFQSASANPASNGISVTSGNSYVFTLKITVASLSSSTNAVSISFAGTATIAGEFTSLAGKATAPAATVIGAFTMVGGQIVGSNTNTSLFVFIQGQFDCTGSGTVIPQITQVTNSAAATIKQYATFIITQL